jgi:hypothetical protein
MVSYGHAGGIVGNSGITPSMGITPYGFYGFYGFDNSLLNG